MNIWFGTNENAVLSNLALRPFIYYISESDSFTFKTVEHGYQTLKCGRIDWATYQKPWKEGSKFIGMPADRSRTIPLMQALISQSFRQNPDKMNILLRTGRENLTHLQDRGIWRHWFPRILMELRHEELKKWDEWEYEFQRMKAEEAGIISE
jgi:hypothetical protein